MHCGSVLKVIKPLYGIKKSVLRLYLTYLGQHLGQLGMRRSAMDPFVLYNRTDYGITGSNILKVDDSYGFGNDEFLTF